MHPVILPTAKMAGRRSAATVKISPTASPTAAAVRPRPTLAIPAALDASTANPDLSLPPPPLPSHLLPSPYRDDIDHRDTSFPPPLDSSSRQHPSPSRRNSLLRRGRGGHPDSFLRTPFRTRRGAARLPELSAARLWNPTNSTPRDLRPPPTTRPRRLSTPPPPPVPLPSPGLQLPEDATNPTAVVTAESPLLTLAFEERENRPTLSRRASLQLDRCAGAEQRVSLPPSLRPSYDGKRSSATPSPVEEPPQPGPSTSRLQPPRLLAVPEGRRFRSRGLSLTKLQPSLGLSFGARPGSKAKEDKGKGKAVMSPPGDDDAAASAARGGDAFAADLERGPDIMVNSQRLSSASGLSGIGSALSSTNSSIMGEDPQPDAGEEWGPQHPCYPHLNPHVPVDSPEYEKTRIIRVRRDWLLKGDLAPTFSNLYPDILDPAGVSEQEFRSVIDKLNSELVPIFDPYGWRNILDNVLGLATGWLWDDLGFTAAKSRLRNLERWIEQWNEQKEKALAGEEGVIPPKIVPLRQTGYMALDIQIPDPELAPASPTTSTAERDGPDALPAAPPPAALHADMHPSVIAE
ncbi:hypothetical protein VTJ49DRAFT_4087 [Mycothermus thermophilus]|uniref:Ras modification protein ERF4 n=1 Tax=Humicola insolens TaxID=85995 RepID=A0ABR3V6B6_HUMIN